MVTDAPRARENVPGVPDDAKRALNAARADAVALAMELTSKTEQNETLANVARELRRRNDELESRHADLAKRVGDELESIRARAETQDETAARADAQIDLLREQQKILEEKCAAHAEHAERSRNAMATMEELCEAKMTHAEEMRAVLVEELREAREEIVKRRAREDELTKDLKTFGEKFEEFKEMTQTNDSAFEEFQKELAKARNEALTNEKAKLEAQMMKQKADVAMIELLDERETLRTRVKQLEKQNGGLEKLSRALSEKLRVCDEETDTIE
jgi:chromosome segregation ATPase|tara:strand:+ start:354 stop:1175 length:822 start_codon:yes stop_codon:yes gene_type:complete